MSDLKLCSYCTCLQFFFVTAVSHSNNSSLMYLLQIYFLLMIVFNKSATAIFDNAIAMSICISVERFNLQSFLYHGLPVGSLYNSVYRSNFTISICFLCSLLNQILSFNCFKLVILMILPFVFL